jgi:hypothetical protein
MMQEESSHGVGSPSHRLHHQQSGPSSSGKSAAGGGAISGGSGFFNYLKHFDVYTKIDEDYRVQTSSGAICKKLCCHLPPESC